MFLIEEDPKKSSKFSVQKTISDLKVLVVNDEFFILEFLYEIILKVGVQECDKA